MDDRLYLSPAKSHVLAPCQAKELKLGATPAGAGAVGASDNHLELEVATLSANVGSGGSWSADPTMQVAVLAGNGSNQDQAYLTTIPEPASVAALAAGLFGMGLIRRRERSAT